MDITTVFGTVVPGSNPGGGTKVRSSFVPPSTLWAGAARIRRPCEHFLIPRRKSTRCTVHVMKESWRAFKTRNEKGIRAIMFFERIWFSGKMSPCQGLVGSSILPIRTRAIKTIKSKKTFIKGVFAFYMGLCPQ
jgi:hypothetical protein